MRLPGRIAPAAGVGPLGQVASALLPTRIAAAKDVASCLVRPAISLPVLVSDGVAAAAGDCAVSAFALTSPVAVRVEPAAFFEVSVPTSEAFASGLPPQAASATLASATRENELNFIE